MEQGQLFLNSVIERMLGYKQLGEQAFTRLHEKEYHFSPHDDVNSVAQVIRHMHGNMLSRWTNFLTEDGEKTWRQRDREFEPGNESEGELLRLWNEGWDCFLGALHALRPSDLEKLIRIRGESLPVTDAIIRQVGHYAYHVGQIVHIAKTLRGSDWQSLSIPRKKQV